MSTTAGQPPKASASQTLRDFVGRRAEKLQSRFLAEDSSARAALAILRRGVYRPLGADPDTWQIIFDGFPESLEGRSDAPSTPERAAYAALTLFGVHMQSAREKRHIPDVGFGRAVRKAAGRPDAEGNDSPLVKRFHALGTATSFSEVSNHARGLVKQLRAAGVGLDYGMLAADLFNLQDPQRSDGVRLRWARDLYRLEPQESETESTQHTES